MGDNSMFAVACATEGKTAGWLPESYGFLRIHKVNNYYAMAEYQVVWPNAELWRGYYNAGDDGLKWSGWQPISTATKPQEFDLSLAEGLGKYGKCTYWKTQDGICFVNFAVSSSGLQNESVIATLPAGFRPADVVISGGQGVSENARVATDIEIRPNGIIKIWSETSILNCSGFVGFVADG